MRAISFCELLHLFTGDSLASEEIINKSIKKAGFESTDRLYVGSNFCCRYFLRYAEKALDNIATLKKAAVFSHIKTTLCLPIFSQRYLESGKKLIPVLLKKYADFIDEVTVNDYGMLVFAQSFKGVKINVGRLMNKDVRDIRHSEYYNAGHTPSAVGLSSSVLDGFEISRYEFDLTNRFLDFKDFGKEIAVYAPYVYATTGLVCEFGSARKDVSQKFRANSDCNFDCTVVCNQYKTGMGEEYVKIGRTVYFKIDDYVVTAKSGYRLIYEPFDLFLPVESNQ